MKDRVKNGHEKTQIVREVEFFFFFFDKDREVVRY